MFSFRLKRLLRLISLAHCKIYLPWAIGPGFFLAMVAALFCVFANIDIYTDKFRQSLVSLLWINNLY